MALIKLIKEISTRVDSEGKVEVKFREPEFPYHFDFDPILKPVTFNIYFEVIGGTLKILRTKPGRPAIAEIYYNNDELKIFRNDEEMPRELLQSFFKLCVVKTEILKGEKFIWTDQDYVHVKKNYYESVRRHTRLKWNDFMENK